LKEIKEEFTSCNFFVTLIDKTTTGAKSKYWGYNAGFETKSSAEAYRKSLIPMVNEMNREPPDHREIQPRQGVYILPITSNASPTVKYRYYKF
jgi:hypothetical protein